MKLLKEKEQIIKYSLKMVKSALTTGSGGNLSIFNRDKGLIAITPSGIEYNELTPKDIIIIDIDGNIYVPKISELKNSNVDHKISNYDKYQSVSTSEISTLNMLKPSSETLFHIALYRKREDINAIVHTHSPYATTFASLNREILPIHYLVAFSGRKVPIAPYATFGTKELADNITSTIGSCNAILLANHGLVAVGNSIETAFNTAEEIEFAARICYQAECIGKPIMIDDYEMDKVIEKFKNYGIPNKTHKK